MIAQPDSEHAAQEDRQAQLSENTDNSADDQPLANVMVVAVTRGSKSVNKDRQCLGFRENLSMATIRSNGSKATKMATNDDVRPGMSMIRK